MKLPTLPRTRKAHALKSLMFSASSFEQCSASARAALKRGDVESARWWGAQAREDWRHVQAAFTA